MTIGWGLPSKLASMNFAKKSGIRNAESPSPCWFFDMR